MILNLTKKRKKKKKQVILLYNIKMGENIFLIQNQKELKTLFFFRYNNSGVTVVNSYAIQFYLYVISAFPKV